MTCSCAASFLVAVLTTAPLWQTTQRGGDSIEKRFEPPKGFTRTAAAPDSLGAFLRALPLFDGNPDVLLYDGSLKRYQRGHLAVVDIDVGKHALPQCADAAMRLLAEYRFARKLPVCFTATSGDAMPWERYAKGERPSVSGHRLTWSSRAHADASHDAFRGYLDSVFTWADGSPIVVIGLGRFGQSLSLELMDLGLEVLGIDSDPRVVQAMAGELASAPGVTHQGTHHLRERLLLAGHDHPGVRPEQRPRTGEVVRDARQTGTHRLEQGQRHPLVARPQHAHVRLRQQSRHVVGIAQELDAIGETEVEIGVEIERWSGALKGPKTKK